MFDKPKTRNLVLSVIENEWPLSVTGVTDKLNELNGSNFSIQAIKYHFDSLKAQHKLRTKKIGRNLVAWPIEMEKLRIIHDLMKV